MDKNDYYFAFRIKRSNFAVVIELARHIEILLLRNDCVIVPGLGGFMASHIPARYDDNDKMFLPPLRTLGFNVKLNVNDSLLAQSYSEAYDISYPEACERIDSEVNELKQCLGNDGFYELNDIGTLYLNDEGKVEFAPCEAGILTPELYSLSSFEMKKGACEASVEKEVERKMPVREKVGTVTFATTPVSEPTPTILPVAGRTDDVNAPENEKTISIKLSLIRNMCAAIIAVFIFFALSSPVENGNNTIKMGYMDNGIIHNLISKGYDNIKKSTEVSLVEKKTAEQKEKSEAVDATVNKEEAVQPAAARDDFYCIVLASQVSRKNAEAYSKLLKSKGFALAETLMEKGKSAKVVYGHFKTKNEAYNKLNDLKGSEFFYEAWVYQVRN